MKVATNCILFILLFYFIDLSATEAPSPFINSVNVITGKTAEYVDPKEYEFYTVGNHSVEGKTIQISKDDWRVGRVKLQKNKDSEQKTPAVCFIYYPNYTEVYDALHHKTIYHYSAERLEIVEHYQADNHSLYRKEHLFWDTSSNKEPRLMSRTLEDGQGIVHFGCFFTYNSKGLLIKETLAGNLSGTCLISPSVQSDGTLENNGIETYSTAYEYSSEEPYLLMSQKEDNGTFIHYTYEPKTTQCKSKIRGNAQGFISRCFYSYDSLGLLNRTVIDDGSSLNENDLTGATTRHILSVQSCQEGLAFGQPRVSENKYLNLETQQEISLEKVVNSYSPKGLLTQKDFYDADGKLRYYIHMNYDEQGHLVSTVDSRGEAAVTPEQEEGQCRYNASKQKEAFIDKYGNETSYIYDTFGRLTKTIFPKVLSANDTPFQPMIVQEYDIRNNIISVTDANGYTTHSTYNVRGKPIEIIHSNDSRQTFTYFLDGQLKEKVDQTGRKTIFERDSFGRVLKQEEQAPSGEILQTLVYEYDQSALTSVTDNKSFTIRFLYDAAGRQIATLHETKDGIRRREWSYDACGQKVISKEWYGSNEQDFVAKIEVKDCWQQTIGMRFEDAQGHTQRSQSVAKQEQTDTIFSQDSSHRNRIGQYVRQQETVDAQGLQKVVIHDALNRPETLMVFNSMGSKIIEKQFRYDGNGTKVLEKQSVLVEGQTIRHHIVEWQYDCLKRLISINEGAGSPQQKRTVYQYNSVGLIEHIAQPNGIVLIYDYDSYGRPSQFYANDQSFNYQYTYDDLGRPVQITDPIHHYTIFRRYNAFNELIEETFNSGLTVKNAYDLAGRKIALTLPDESSVFYQYEGALLHSVQRFNQDQTKAYEHTYFYDTESGKVLESNLIGNSGQLDYRYNSQGCLVNIHSEFWSEQIPPDGFDSHQPLTKIVIQDPAGIAPQSFTYTADNQIASEEGHFNHQYQYDSVNNRIGYDGTEWSVNDLNQLIKTNQAIYTYDTNGNLIEKKSDHTTINYEYDGLNRLSRIVNDQQTAVHYLYDPWHRRLAQEVYQWDSSQSNWQLIQTSYFLYDGNKEIGKANADGKIEELRILGLGKGAEISAAIAIELKDQIYTPIHDHQGSVRCLIDAKNHTVAEFYRYSAFGQEQIFDEQGNEIESSLVGNPWRFASKRYDTESQYIFFGKRYYDPAIGRWITPDPLFFYDGPNLYAFVKNDPLTHTDLYGLFSISSIWDTAVQGLYEGWLYIQRSANAIQETLVKELKGTQDFISNLERVGRKIFGEAMMLLMGFQRDAPETGTHGQGEVNNKVRITFINGILTTRSILLENLELISKSHGGVNVHYIFRPTEGWTWDMGRAIAIKLAYNLGFRSSYCHLLAETWKRLIQEMGGTEGGGVIIHYAHSLGGSDTDRAKDLLTPEEQKMIRIVTLGSSTCIRNENYQSVINYISTNDGVSVLIDPLGHIRNLFDPNSNIVWKNEFFAWPCWPVDHLLTGNTYRTLLFELGEKFLNEFSAA